MTYSRQIEEQCSTHIVQHDKKRSHSMEGSWKDGQDHNEQPQPSSANEEEVFIVRIVCLDYYLAKPISGLDICHSQLEGTAIERVPVVQIYGATPGGQKTCLHLHKVGPFTSWFALFG